VNLTIFVKIRGPKVETGFFLKPPSVNDEVSLGIRFCDYIVSEIRQLSS
jgi:hypothetical protein